jgi:uncharacterized protein YjiS (DUF1127 family)
VWRRCARHGVWTCHHSRTGAAKDTHAIASWRITLARRRSTYTERRRLLRYHALDQRLARDIGLTPGDIEVERHSPFWVPIRPRD